MRILFWVMIYLEAVKVGWRQETNNNSGLENTKNFAGSFFLPFFCLRNGNIPEFETAKLEVLGNQALSMHPL